MIIYKCRDVKTPDRGTDRSAGIDFYVPNDYKGIEALGPRQSTNIPSGIHVRIPVGTALVMFNKSGVATKKGLQVGACVIDEDYQGEVHLHVTNIGSHTTFIAPGMKLVQGIVLRVSDKVIQEAKSLDELYFNHSTVRGDEAFGSTGEL